MNWRRTLGLTVLSGVIAAALLPELSDATPSSRNGEIAFSTPVNGVNQVFTVHPDGTGLRQITQVTTEAGQYGISWSPDGTRLLFSVTKQGRDLIARANADGTGVAVLSPPCTDCFSDGDATYSPDGAKIAFDRAFLPVDKPSGIPIFTMNADGTHMTQLTPKSASTFYFGPQWSPDGTKIAFVRSNTTATPSNKGAIEVMNADGSNVRRLTPFRIDATNPRWSPNGRLILYNTYATATQGKSANLFTMHADGTHRAALTHYAGGTLQAFADAWSPNGKQIVFHRVAFSGTDTQVGHFYIFNVRTKHIRRLPSVRITGDARAAWGK